jgi:hypothetical protein
MQHFTSAHIKKLLDFDTNGAFVLFHYHAPFALRNTFVSTWQEVAAAVREHGQGKASMYALREVGGRSRGG